MRGDEAGGCPFTMKTELTSMIGTAINVHPRDTFVGDGVRDLNRKSSDGWRIGVA